MWRLNQIIYTKYFWGYVLFWILICLGLWYWLEGNDRLVIEILKGPNLSQNSFLVLSIWLLHWFIIHAFFLAVVYRRRASDFFMEVIRFSSIKLWIRYQIWTCFLLWTRFNHGKSSSDSIYVTVTKLGYRSFVYS